MAVGGPPRAPSRKSQNPRRRTPPYTPVRTASTLNPSSESHNQSSSHQTSVHVDNQRGAHLGLKAISAHGLAPLFQNYPRGYAGAARANWARLSVKVSKISSESTRRHGGPSPRPTKSKATFPRKTAGNFQPATGRTDT